MSLQRSPSSNRLVLNLGSNLSARLKALAQHQQQEDEDYIQILREKTFVPKTGRFKCHGKQVEYSKTSLFMFTDTQMIRKLCVWIMEWVWFDRFIMLCILGNSICLAMFDYSDRDATTNYNQYINLVGKIFTIIFTLEAIFKIIAMGFVIHKLSYLREGWNFIDFIIVITGVLDFVSSSVNLKSLRTLRVMRPLRSINAIPSMRRLVATLISSLPELGNATIFVAFIVVLFSILGLQQYNGISYNRCRLTQQPLNATYWPISPDHKRVCSITGDGEYTCPSGLYCGKLQIDFKIMMIGNPIEYQISLKDDGAYNDPMIQFGIANFDNFGQAILALFQIITRDNWTQLMYNMIDGSNSIFAKIYFSMIILLGSFFLLNLLLAVIMQSFSKLQVIEPDGKESPEKQSQNQSKIASPLKSIRNEIQTGEDENQEKPEQLDLISQVISNNMFKTFNSCKKEDQKEHSLKDPSLPVKNVDICEEQKSPATPTKKFLNFKPEGNNEKQSSRSLTHRSQTYPDERLTNIFEDRSKSVTFKENGPLSIKNQISKIGKLHVSQQNKTEADFYKEKFKRSQTITDKGLQIKMQEQITEEQGQKLKLMEKELQKNFQDTRKNYGIDNEENIVHQIRLNLKEQINKHGSQGSPLKSQLSLNSSLMDHVGEGEIDLKTLIALRIQSQLREQVQKELIREQMFAKFRDMLYNKNKLEKVMQNNELQLKLNILSIRAERFCFLKLCFIIAASPYFTSLMTAFIIMNTVVLSMDQYPIESKMKQNMELVNLACFGAFCFELLVKIIGFGPRSYFKDRFNTFDCSVVILSCLDVALQYANINSSVGSGAISALRTFRLLRIFKLAKQWKQFQDLLRTIGNTMKDMSNFSILLLLFIYTYSLLGMELFAYKVKFNEQHKLDLTDSGTYPNSTFNNFIEAFVSVFIVLANDGWTNIFFNHYRATNGVVSSIFFVSLLIVGQYILLNLFIAILIENFEQESLNQEVGKKETKLNLKRQLTNCKNSIRKFAVKVFCSCKKNKEVQQNDQMVTQPSSMIQIIINKLRETDPKLQTEEQKKMKSLFMFGQDNRFRQWILKIIQHSKFEYVMLVFILLSTIQLCMDSPLLDPAENKIKMLNSIDQVLTIIFALEATLKIIAYGFMMNGPKSYLQNNWNILDIIVVILSILSLSFGQNDYKFVKIFRVLKVLRPLRAISRNEGLRLSLHTLMIALPGIFNVMVISGLFYLIFGIIGINYFKGRYYACFTDHLQISKFTLEQLNDKWDCLNVGGEWINNFQNFDNIRNAILTLFTASTTVQWSDLMYKGAANRGINFQPKHLNGKAYTFFFVLFIVVSSFFMLNLFVGVIISTYNREKESMGKDFLLTNKQKKWLETKIMLIQAKPLLRMKMPNSEWRHPFFFLAMNKWFGRFIYACILINTIFLALDWYGQNETTQVFSERINYVFAAIFTLEAAVKLIAFGTRYFKDEWNIFDLIIVVLTIAGIALSQAINTSFGPQTTVIRSFRIGRVFKLFRRNKSLQIIFQTFLVTLPAMANIGSLLLLLVLIYAILGVQLFATVMHNGDLKDHATFETVGSAFLTLIRVSTGERWNLLLQATTKEYSNMYQCISYPTYQDYVSNDNQPVGCGSMGSSVIYFFTFVLIISLVYLKLFIAIILQGFQDTSDQDCSLFSSDTSDFFREVWSRSDPDATGFIRVSDYPRFLLGLGEPLGWDPSYRNNYEKQQEYLAEINLPKYNKGKNYQFMDVLENLAMLMIVNKEIEDYIKKQDGDDETIGLLREEFNSEIKEVESKLNSSRQVSAQRAKKINTYANEGHHNQNIGIKVEIAINSRNIKSKKKKKKKKKGKKKKIVLEQTIEKEQMHLNPSLDEIEAEIEAYIHETQQDQENEMNKIIEDHKDIKLVSKDIEKWIAEVEHSAFDTNEYKY